jgi:hypothetical protein
MFDTLLAMHPWVISISARSGDVLDDTASSCIIWSASASKVSYFRGFWPNSVMNSE